MADNGAARGAGRGDGSSSDGAAGLDLLANAAAASVRASCRFTLALTLSNVAESDKNRRTDSVAPAVSFCFN